ncbi:MAG: Gfo/Idh/MocA family oxidoreductase [Spirochaetes bacterium]|nr:Gfo/Idh/MocA family oxidoreductase [Spirochaetota bacterium]
MKNDKLIFGLIGSGIYARVHARAYNADPRVTLKLLWSPTRSHREETASQFECRASETWEEIIEDKSIDCVAVVTPDFAHTDYAVASLNEGKHVLLEKPMAMSGDECRKIISARDSSGKKLMVNYHNRWYPAFAAGRDTILSGNIGKPVSGNFVLSDTICWVEENMRWAHKTGPEWYLMSHTADLAFWMLGEKPVEIFAMAREGLLKSKGFATRDLVKAIIKMEGGAVVHFESSWVLARNWRNPVNDMRVSVQCEEGRIDVIADYENITITSESYKTPLILFDQTEVDPIKDFISCVIDDRPVPVTGEDGLLTTRVIEAVVRSYKENRVVLLDEIK